MSNLTLTSLQVGLDADPNNNFTIALDNDALKISRGNASAPGTEILTLSDTNTTITNEIVADNFDNKLHVKKITRGYHSGALLTSDNRIYTWGYNNNSQLGDGTSTTSPINQIQFPAYLSGVKIVQFEQWCSANYVLFENGHLYVWGYNGYGQLGVGDTTNRTIPTLSASDVAKIFVPASQYSNEYYNAPYTGPFIQKNDSTVYSCGYNGVGALAVGNTTNRSSWTLVPNPNGEIITDIWVGADPNVSVFCKTNTKKIYAAGYNGNGQLGLGDTTDRTSWTNVSYFNNLPEVVDIKCCGYYWDNTNGYNRQFTTVLTSSGDVYTVGRNDNAQLGTGTVTTYQASFTKVTLTKPVKSFSMCWGTVYVIFTDDNFARWGYNGYGQLGNGTTTQNPNPIYGTFTVKKIFTTVPSGSGTYAPSIYLTTTSNELYGCGYNYNGQLGNGSTSSSVTNFTLSNFSGKEIEDVIQVGQSGYSVGVIQEANSNNIYVTCGYNVNLESGLAPSPGTKYMFRQINIK
jgi:alpha-tubulin suppressor-like RCC1 family protein